MADVVSFYKALPQGAAPALSKTANPFKLYYRKYFHPKNGKASGAPILHLILGVFLFGYISDYQFHREYTATTTTWLSTTTTNPVLTQSSTTRTVLTKRNEISNELTISRRLWTITGETAFGVSSYVGRIGCSMA